jgi:TRAP-type mannitol/chloroaromatic compound transport system substrate-binding protein
MVLKLLLGGTLAAVMALGAISSASAEEERHRWKMHSAFGSKLAVLGPAGVRVSDNITELSQGTINVKFFEPNALVPGVQYYDAVASGSLDSAWGSPGYHMGQNTAFGFFTAVPFGPGFAEYNAWMFYGGGHKIYQDMMAKANIHGRICGMIPPESSGWFRQEVKSINDLKGIKMRFFGLGARVMEKMGVSTQLLAGGDIYPALELGSIDATEFAMPSIDETLGFYQIAKHYYFPGWHQPSSFGELLVHMEKWKKLSKWQMKVVDIVCDANIMQEYVEGESQQGAALNRMRNNHGVNVHSWSDADLAILEAKWKEVAAEESVANPDFGLVWKHYSAYREEQKEWRSRGYLK